MTVDPILIAARESLAESFAEVRRCLEGLPVEALNWRPAGTETNSLAVLITHALASTRAWICISLNLPRPQRDRDAEFLAIYPDVATARAYADSIIAECERLQDDARVADWSVTRPTSGEPAEPTAAWALLHSVEHLREHVGQMLLTRQLWEQRAGP